MSDFTGWVDDLENNRRIDYRFPRKIICPLCRGEGLVYQVPNETCDFCKGYGYFYIPLVTKISSISKNYE